MRALVTGGAGFVGSHLCTRLLDEGLQVVVLDNLLTGYEANLGHLLPSARLEVVVGDAATAERLPGPFTHVLHLASAASPVHYLAHPIETLRVGSEGTLAALEVARRDRARFLLASTSEVYGDPAVHPQDEGYWGNVNPIGPRSVYDESKRFAEALTMAYRRTHRVNTTIIRIFNTYGPRMALGDGRAVPAFIEAGLLGAPIPLHGDGSQTRSLTYVDDLVEGMYRLLSSDHAGPVNIGNPQELTMLDIAEVIRRLTGSRSEIEFLPRPADDPERRKPDISAAERALGWRPTIGYLEGLQRTVEWFRSVLPVSIEGTRP